jgi:hypothetical protein
MFTGCSQTSGQAAPQLAHVLVVSWNGGHGLDGSPSSPAAAPDTTTTTHHLGQLMMERAHVQHP